MSKSIDPLRTTAPELHSKWNHLVVSGCSFTAGTSNPEQARNNPQVWAHFVLRELQCSRFANLAIPGGGNLAAGLNLVYYLNSHACDPESTMVMFNVTEFDRIDIPTRHHPDSNRYFSWAEDMDLEWITEGPFSAQTRPFQGRLQKNMGYQSTVLFNVLQLMLLQEYLISKGYTYRWMYMSDRCRDQIPDHLASTMRKFADRQITFGKHDSMYEYVASMNMTISQDNDHPSVQGHQKIADRILEVLNETQHG